MLKDLIHLLFPETCVCCQKVLNDNEPHICHSCLTELPVVETDDLTAYKKLAGRVKLQCAYAYLKFNKGGRAQKILHELKYKGNSELGFFVGRRFANYLAEQKINLEIDFLIPVPLDKKRLKSRGYNQAEAFAKGFAEVGNFTLDCVSIIKTKEAVSQIRKKRMERLENMQNCFTVSSSALLKDKNVAIVDDVITTGATLEACCLCLESAGVKKITVLSLAVA